MASPFALATWPSARSRHDTAPAPAPAELSDPAALEIVLQPIVAVATGALLALEALARFPTRPGQPVEQVFALAHAAEWGHRLEAACLHAALARRNELPAGVWLTVNLSPQAASQPAVRQALPADLRGVVIEITEAAAGDARALVDAIADIRARGALIAADDATTDAASLLRLATLRPDLVKIDRSLVTGARDNPAQSEAIKTLVAVSRRLRARVIGEGAQTRADLRVLAELGVHYAQGWAIASPTPHLPTAPYLHPAPALLSRVG